MIKYFHRIIFFSALIIYSITAYNSHGYYHADEHYQIIEFAGLKLGTNTTNDLAWEYKVAIRSSLQPSICFTIFKMLNLINIKDPYTRMFMLRFLTSILALLVINFFVKSSIKYLNPRFIRLFIILSYFLWFLPVLNVRFSSESWAGLSFMMAIVIIQSDCNRKTIQYLIAGSLLGLCFLFRFQMILLYVGLILWLFLIKKEILTNIILLITSILLVISIGVLLDFWYYQKSVLTFWNYFYINIAEGTSSNFGTSPWYYYLYFFTSVALFLY
jgi:GPI mannosyltransferase 3